MHGVYVCVHGVYVCVHGVFVCSRVCACDEREKGREAEAGESSERMGRPEGPHRAAPVCVSSFFASLLLSHR